MALITIREATQIFRCSKAFVYRQIRLGRWPYLRTGPRSLRLDLAEIRRLSRLVAEIEIARAKSQEKGMEAGG
jgi:excisionase family DNA binding protein